MTKEVYQVKFNIFKDFFEVDSLDDHFMIFDNLIEMIHKNNMDASIIFNFPVKLEDVMFAFCTQGYLKTRIGLKDFTLQKNHFMVVMSGPGQIFQVTDLSPDFKATFVVLKSSFFNMQSHVIQAMALQQIVNARHCLPAPDDLIPEFELIFNLIKEKMKEDSFYRMPIIQNYLNILFYNACNLFLQKEKENEPSNRKKEIFESFIKEVETHFREQHEVKFYADKLCLTPKYLSKLIAQVSDKSAVEWIKDYLVLEARALLNSSSFTIQQISNKLNFANQSHFGRFFKQHTGVSPREYRKH